MTPLKTDGRGDAQVRPRWTKLLRTTPIGVRVAAVGGLSVVTNRQRRHVPSPGTRSGHVEQAGAVGSSRAMAAADLSRLHGSGRASASGRAVPAGLARPRANLSGGGASTPARVSMRLAPAPLDIANQLAGVRSAGREGAPVVMTSLHRAGVAANRSATVQERDLGAGGRLRMKNGAASPPRAARTGDDMSPIGSPPVEGAEGAYEYVEQRLARRQRLDAHR